MTKTSTNLREEVPLPKGLGVYDRPRASFNLFYVVLILIVLLLSASGAGIYLHFHP